ncbi:response regulator transcription factor [Tahibacter sp.]|uniref:response regulator transcription factor n=1 Tax=Tahibacter sp. TaxID=2056211 RepID=UPI0028C40399|nr:response regulator transcription factor [Tahibacter sp.]
MSEVGPAVVLIVDDERQIRRFLEISLQAQGYETLSADSGAEALKLAATRSVALVVLDLGLPDMDGHQVLQRLREWTKVPILVLSARSGEAEKVRALDAGANDYLVKPFGVEELGARIRVLLRASAAPAAPVVFDDGRLRVDLARREVQLDGVTIALPRKEFEILSLLVRNRGMVLTQRQILVELWGAAHVEDTHYLRVAIGRLRRRLGDDASAPRWIHTEPGVGYRLISP